MESEGAKSVAISATFAIILNDLFVLMQLTYESGELQKTFVLESVCMRPEMKYTRNDISLCHEKNSVYITFYYEQNKYNFALGVAGVNQLIKKCKQTRARYRDKHVRGNNVGIY